MNDTTLHNMVADLMRRVEALEKLHSNYVRPRGVDKLADIEEVSVPSVAFGPVIARQGSCQGKASAPIQESAADRAERTRCGLEPEAVTLDDAQELADHIREADSA